MSKFIRIAAPFIVPADIKSHGLRLVFDIEANGLLDTASKAHCVAVADLESDQIDEYGPQEIPAALKHLARADYLTGHNICGYDLPLLHRLYNWTPKAGCTVLDTLVASRLILPHVGDLDDQAAAMGDPPLGKLRGRDKLEAWGIRLCIPKVGADISDYSKWTPDLQARCVGDVVITRTLWRFLRPDGYSRQALELEHRVAAICNRITRDGVPFDKVATEQLYEQWKTRRAKLEAQLQQQFPGTNLNSRRQIGALLEARGWKPEKRTEKTGQPRISDELLETIPALYPEFAGLAEHFILSRRLGQLASGDQAWRNHVGPDGHIHGSLVHIGTPHSRAKHLNPNLAQVPNPKKGKPFATECRALFRAGNDWVFVATDQASLQDRCYAHYLSAFDGGVYAKAFLDGNDTHWQSAVTLGLISKDTARDKQSKAHEAIREGAKRFRYAFLYGCGNETAGRIVHDTVRAVHQIDPANRLQEQFFGDSAHPGEATLKQAGRLALTSFEAGTPGLRKLRQSLEARARQHGWVPGLDGRRVPVRALYTTLNYIVTSAEAIICKRWLALVYDELRLRFCYGWNGDVVIVLWIHDELVCCCRPEIAEQVGEIMVRYAKEPGDFYQLKVPLDAGFRIGRSWAGESETRAGTLPEIPEPVIGPELVQKLESGLELEEPLQHLFQKTPARMPEPNQAAVAEPETPQIVTAALLHVAPIEEPARCNGGEVHIPAAKPIVLPSLPELIPHSVANGKVHCPFHDDDTPSCHIYADHFHCFGCGAHGTTIDWLRDVEGMDYGAAMELLARWSGPIAQRRASTDARMLGFALRLWEAAQPIAGTPAIKYLADIRGIDVDVLPPDVDAVLRFHSSCPFAPGASHPCLLALFQDVESDAPAGIHRIALTAETLAGGKVKRRMLGSWSAARAIKLWPATSRLFLSEGIETALAAGTRMQFHGGPMRPAWAAGSSSNMAKLSVLPGIEQLVLLVDHDGAGQSAAKICRQTWSEAGRDVVRLRPRRPGADFNDLVLDKLRTAP